jgi:hypothetical protein
MAELIDRTPVNLPGGDGWAVDYRIRRDDGEEVHAEVRCTETARAVAERAGNEKALAAMGDRGQSVALAYAESVQSPAKRGEVTLFISFDPIDGGNVTRDVQYSRDLT